MIWKSKRFRCDVERNERGELGGTGAVEAGGVLVVVAWMGGEGGFAGRVWDFSGAGVWRFAEVCGGEPGSDDLSDEPEAV
jgi:hypothetical protein